MEHAQGEHRVRGTISGVKGRWRGLRCRVWDRDLRHVQLLGVVCVDRRGRYALRYAIERLCRPERGTADLVVQVVDRQGCLLAGSSVRFNASDDEVIDLELPPRLAASELESLWEAVEPILEGISPAELSDEEVAFVAGEAELPERRVAALRDAVRRAAEPAVAVHGLGVEVLYALLRRGAPDETAALLGTPLSRLLSWLDQALAARIIGACTPAERAAIEGRLRAAVEAHVSRRTGVDEPSSLDELLATSALSDAARAKVIAIALDAEPGDPAFDQALEGTLEGDELTETRATLELADVTGSNAALMRALQDDRRQRGLGGWRHLAARTVTDWEAAIGDEVPPTVPGDTLEERRTAYAVRIRRGVEKRHPTAVMAETLARASGDDDDDLVAFLRGAEGLDILATDVRDYAAAQNVPPGEATLAKAERAQRVRRTVSNASEARAVLAAGFDSASQIAAAGRRFVEQLGPVLGVGVSKRLHRQASLRSQVAQALLLQVWEAGAVGMPRALGSEKASLPAAWETLFGAADYCACEHCASVLSPAAYLVDLLSFLEARGVLALLERSHAQVRRRPDVRHIALSCANTHTEVPYLDLVNEILEDAIAPVDLPARQTTRTASELQTRPEHLDARVYDRLRDETQAAYPWQLPFDLWSELARAYLGELGIPRAELLDAYGSVDDAAAERLGLSRGQWRLVAGTAAVSTAEVWGVDDPAAALATVSDLLAHLSLRYEELDAIGRTGFVGGLSIVGLDTCDTTRMRVTNLAERLDALHRFVRLQRALGWEPELLDRAWSELRGADDETTLRALATLVRTARALGWTIDETIADRATPGRVTRLAETFSRTQAEITLLGRMIDVDVERDGDPSIALRIQDAHRRVMRAGFTVADLAYVVLGEADGRAPTAPRLEGIAEAVRGALHDAPGPERATMLAQLLASSLGAEPAFWEDAFRARPAALAPFLDAAFLDRGDDASALAMLRVLSRVERAVGTLSATPADVAAVLDGAAPSVAFDTLAPPPPSDLPTRSGVDEATLRRWASEPSEALASELEAVVRERAGDDWPRVGKRLRDPIRERQAAALSAHLLGGGRPAGATWRNSSDLYAHFLVDPEMTACATTSRIKLAHLSVQLFVQRLFMNLEPGAVVDADADPDWRQWDWRQSFRVWEAGRRVLLHTENLLAPELRRDKTPLFLELESTLLSDEVTEERAVDALVGYLEGLGRIAHLEVVGFTREERVDREVVHVFGRTRSEPATYWYRRLEKAPHGARWTPWQKVGVAIDDGDALLPVVWNGQLYLFWPHITERTEPPEMDMPAEGERFPQGRERSELRLAWSRYRHGEWSPKELSPSAGPLPAADLFHPRLRERHWEGGGGLSILCNLDFRTSGAIAIDSATRLSAAFSFAHPSARPRVFWEGAPRDLPDGDWVSEGAAVIAPNGELRLAPQRRRIALDARGSLRLMPPSRDAFTRPHELVVEDATRSLFLDWDSSEELLAAIHDHLESGNVIAAILLALAEIGTIRYRAQLFHAPFVQALLATLHTDGLEGLYRRRLQLEPWAPAPAPAPLEDEYAMDPHVVASPYPRDDVDFSSSGAYATYYWELFVHAPLFIAEQLRQNQRFEEARRWLHFVFDPTDASDLPAPQRYWVARPFHEAASSTGDARIESILDPARRADDELLHQVEVWADDPFDAHRLARLRPLAYMKHVFMRYLDLLIEEGDHVFRGATDWEDLNRATQLYVRAADLLGPAPQKLPARERGEPRSYDQLRDQLDPLGNAAIATAERHIGSIRLTKGSLLAATASPELRARVPEVRLGFIPYFCFPPNPKLLSYWDTVADRLFKLRHCQDIEGGALDLPLFEPPIDPAVLARARELGVDVRDALRDASTLPHYRFEALHSSARQLVSEVRSFGATLQSALERRDAEELSLLRASQELELLERLRTDRERQVEDARRASRALAHSIEMTTLRRDYYASREYMNAGEAAQLALLTQAMVTEHAAGALDLVGNVIQLIPDFKVGSPFSIGATFGGSNLGPALRAFAAFTRSQGTAMGTQASMSGIVGSYQRRMEEWTLQRELATTELSQLAQQAASAKLREEIAKSELRAHDRRIAHATETHALLRDKFTSQNLYTWMASQIAATYFAAYQLAHQAARRAERALSHELADPDVHFVRPGTWDSLREGLTAGEQLALDLSRMEVAYRERNAREHELTKHVSLRDVDPLALLTLRETGACFFVVPEAVFDRDFPSHVLRRIRSVALTMPCVTGPLTGVPCTLSLVASRLRDVDGTTEDAPVVPVRSVALSTGQNDAGLFEPTLADPRYLPFEGAGAVSQWRIELPESRPFDYRTIADVVLHMRYTARDAAAVRPVEPPAPAYSEERVVLFSAKRELPDGWARFVDEAAALSVELGPERFPFTVRDAGAAIQRVEILAALASATALSVRLTEPDGRAHEDALATHPDVASMMHVGFDVGPRPLASEPSTWTLALTAGDAESLDDLYLLVRYTTA